MTLPEERAIKRDGGGQIVSSWCELDVCLLHYVHSSGGNFIKASIKLKAMDYLQYGLQWLVKRITCISSYISLDMETIYGWIHVYSDVLFKSQVIISLLVSRCTNLCLNVCLNTMQVKYIQTILLFLATQGTAYTYTPAETLSILKIDQGMLLLLKLISSLEWST